jgi:hypothetical protein
MFLGPLFVYRRLYLTTSGQAATDDVAELMLALTLTLTLMLMLTL